MTKAKTKDRVKVAAAADTVPQNAAQADEAIARIGELQRRRTDIEVRMNDALAQVKAKFEAEAKPLSEEIAERVAGVHTYCAANRIVLTREGKTKTHRFAAGEVKWRSRPPKVSLRNVEKILEELMRLDLTRFIRFKQEVNKEAMLAEPDVAGAVKGVSIGSAGEDFVIEPFSTELEEVA
jgi:phage host-nuclease inhibitor protein Gam